MSQISLQISYCLPRPEFSVMSQKPICIFFPQCLAQLFKVYFLPKILYHTTLNMVLLPLYGILTIHPFAHPVGNLALAARKH